MTLIARESALLHQFDPMISEVLSEQMSDHGIELHMNTSVTGLQKSDAGYAVRIGERLVDGFDQVIWAVGRTANSAQLNPAAAGLATSAGGCIEVDEFQNTSVAGIYAIGDVTGQAALTPVAIAAGRRLAARLFASEHTAKIDYHDIPSVVFAHPPVATIGLTEPQARQQFAEGITVYQTSFQPMRFSITDQQSTTAMKLVCVGDEEQIVGIHLIGHGVDEMLQGFAVALRMGATKADFDRTIAIHPTSAEELVTMKQPVSAPVAEELRKAS